MIYDEHKNRIPLENIFRGWPCFIVSNGPSLAKMDLSQLAKPGFVTIGMNNGPAAFRPNVWIMGDDVKSMLMSTWLDPCILKFLPHGKEGQTLWDNNEWKESNIRVKDCPSTFYFLMNEDWHPAQYLTEPMFHWGLEGWKCMCGWTAPEVEKRGKKKRQMPDDKICPRCGKKDRFGCRSIQFLAVKLAYVLGCREVYLVGADFRMSKDYTYAFKQARASGSVQNNNTYYAKMNERFTELDEHFKKAGFRVWNCTPDSGLKSFDTMPYDKAIARATRRMPEIERDRHGLWVCKDRTEGLYDRKENEKRGLEGPPDTIIRTLAQFLEHRGVDV